MDLKEYCHHRFVFIAEFGDISLSKCDRCGVMIYGDYLDKDEAIRVLQKISGTHSLKKIKKIVKWALSGKKIKYFK